LRPIIDKQETNLTRNTASPVQETSKTQEEPSDSIKEINTSSRRSSKSIQEDAKKMYDLDKRLNQRNEIEQANASYDSSDDTDLYVEDNHTIDNVNKYERLCHDLQIVPCSIIIKSLPTTFISLNNYGLNSTGILALSTTLKVSCDLNSFDSK
jgi:hypothetical protein